GIVITLALAAYQLPGLAARRHSTAVAFLTSDPSTMLEFGLFGLALIGFVLAALRVSAWPLAAIGVVVGSLRAALLGKWVSLVNPVHVLAAGLWIGTLFVLVVAGLSALLAHEPTRARRGAIAADMVNGFSPLALTMGVVVVVFGVITAWRHLHVLSNLWSTPYGMTLIGKLCFVGCVFVLGAWNWRRQRPTLGTEPAAAAIRRSGTVELMFALVVLLVTAILVSLPSTKACGSPPGDSAAWTQRLPREIGRLPSDIRHRSRRDALRLVGGRPSVGCRPISLYSRTTLGAPRSEWQHLTPHASRSRPSEVRHHCLARLIERRVRGHAVRLTDAVDADAIGRRRLVRFQLGAELAGDHAAGLVHLHDPRAAQKVDVVVQCSLGHVGSEPELPRSRVARQRFAKKTEILAERVARDQQIAILARAKLAREYAEHGVVRPAVGGEPDLFHRCLSHTE